MKLIKYGILAFAVLVTACASVKSSPEEIKTITGDEGVVVGSILVIPEALGVGDKGESGFFKPMLASEADFGFMFGSLDGFLSFTFGTKYMVDVKPNKEEFFVKKLAPGTYSFRNINIKHRVWGGSGMQAPFSEFFKVEAGKTTYIGKFEVSMPARLLPNAIFAKKRTNDIENARKAILSEYPDVASKMLPTSTYLKP
jgi:hypothetical protein